MNEAPCKVSEDAPKMNWWLVAKMV